MADIIVESGTMDNETVQVFVSKIDLACTALNKPNQHIEGYGSGIDAAYQLLCEAQAISPDNQAVATEIASLRRIMDTENTNNGNNLPLQAETGNVAATKLNSNSMPSMAEQVMQHWKRKPIIEVLVCVTEDNLKSLADTIDSIAAQTYSNWKLTVISNMPSPDPIFAQHNILQWIQTDNFQQSLNSTINTSNSDWLGLIESGNQLDSEALFTIGNQDNLEGENLQIIYSDEDHIDENKSYCQPLKKPDFDIQQCKDNNFIGSFCFSRKTLLQTIGGIHLNVENKNNDFVLRATNTISASTVRHIPNILNHLPLTQSSNVQQTHPVQSNVA
ncbi:MAG: hypothetical protein COB61_002870 [Thiotrichales bacterium]|nr:hypothetical protein [Thiotrichales bacterium]